MSDRRGYWNERLADCPFCGAEMQTDVSYRQQTHYSDCPYTYETKEEVQRFIQIQGHLFA
jgi:hypothetical protein